MAKRVCVFCDTYWTAALGTEPFVCARCREARGRDRQEWEAKLKAKTNGNG